MYICNQHVRLCRRTKHMVHKSTHHFWAAGGKVTVIPKSITPYNNKKQWPFSISACGIEPRWFDASSFCLVDADLWWSLKGWLLEAKWQWSLKAPRHRTTKNNSALHRQDQSRTSETSWWTWPALSLEKIALCIVRSNLRLLRLLDGHGQLSASRK